MISPNTTFQELETRFLQAMSKLTERRRAFVLAYIQEPNGSKAAETAGYAKVGARQESVRLLADAYVGEAIQCAQAYLRKNAGMDAEWLLRRLLDLADLDLSKLFDDEGRLLHPKDMPLDAQRLVQSFKSYQEYEWQEEKGKKKRVAVGETTEVKFVPRLDVLNQIGRHVDIQAWRDNITLREGEAMRERMARARERAYGPEVADEREEGSGGAPERVH